MIRSAARFLWAAINRFFDHNGPDRAAAVAYYTLLSLLPLLIFLISLGIRVFGSFEQAYDGTMFLIRGVVVHMDQAALDTLRSFVERSVRLQWPGILLLAWTSKRIFGSLLSALESVFEVPGRGFARGNLASLGMVLVTGVGMLATLMLTLVVAGVEGFLQRHANPFGTQAIHTLAALVLTRGLPAFVTFVFFFLVYRMVPRVVTTNHAAIGALLATVLWEAAKAGFAYYVRNLARYAGIYGALEAVIVLGLWLEVSVSIILFCGEIVALLLARNRPAAPPTPAPAPPPDTKDPSPDPA